MLFVFRRNIQESNRSCYRLVSDNVSKEKKKTYRIISRSGEVIRNRLRTPKQPYLSKGGIFRRNLLLPFCITDNLLTLPAKALNSILVLEHSLKILMSAFPEQKGEQEDLKAREAETST